MLNGGTFTCRSLLSFFLCQPFLPSWASPPRFRRKGQRRACLLVFLATRNPPQNTKHLISFPWLGLEGGGRKKKNRELSVCEFDHRKRAGNRHIPSPSALQSSLKGRGQERKWISHCVMYISQSGNEELDKVTLNGPRFQDVVHPVVICNPKKNPPPTCRMQRDTCLPLLGKRFWLGAEE